MIYSFLAENAKEIQCDGEEARGFRIELATREYQQDAGTLLHSSTLDDLDAYK